MVHENDKPDLRGRPTKGENKMTVECKVRMEPAMHRMLRMACKQYECSISDGIREGVKWFIHYGIFK